MHCRIAEARNYRRLRQAIGPIGGRHTELAAHPGYPAFVRDTLVKGIVEELPAQPKTGVERPIKIEKSLELERLRPLSQHQRMDRGAPQLRTRSVGPVCLPKSLCQGESVIILAPTEDKVVQFTDANGRCVIGNANTRLG